MGFSQHYAGDFMEFEAKSWQHSELLGLRGLESRFGTAGGCLIPNPLIVNGHGNARAYLLCAKERSIPF
jgi:hypothetical protein